MKVAIYARVSKTDDSQDTENQLRRLRQYASDHNFDVTKEYVDQASGADPNRPALDQMLRDARANRFKAILVVKIDRIARSVRNLYNMVEEWNENGVKFYCIDQPEVSTGTATGKLLQAILAGMAEFERELIRDRTRAGLERARAEGKSLGRPKKMIDMVAVKKMRGDGASLRDIARKFDLSPDTVNRRLKKEGG